MAQNSYAFTQRVKDQNLDMREVIKEALAESGGSLRLAAERLNITRQALEYQMKRHNLTIRRCVAESKEGAA